MRRALSATLAGISTLVRSAGTRTEPLPRAESGRPGLTPTQELFCQWNAERLAISPAEARGRYECSLSALPGGHAGPEYRRFCELSHEIYRAFVDDRPGEVFEAYVFHQFPHFLRMLAYADEVVPHEDVLVPALAERSRATIVDFGCGLAQISRRLADVLRRNGTAPRLVLADIPTIRKDFLLWIARRRELDLEFLDCTPDVPLPPLPDCDLCIATEVLEHLRDPLRYVAAFDSALRPGGLLLTNLGDHRAEFMHLSPDLARVRERLAESGYESLVPLQVYRKPG